MTASDDPFIKIRHAERDEAELWDDDSLLSWWVRLRVMADAAWPAAADVPRIPARVVRALMAAGRVDVAGNRFRCPEIDAERSPRSAKGAQMAAARWKKAKGSSNA